MRIWIWLEVISKKDIQQRYPDISGHILEYPLNIHIFYPKRYLFKLTWIYPCLSFIILIVYPNHISMFISRKYIHIYPCLSTCIHKNILSYPHYISKRISAKYNHTYPCISMHIHAYPCISIIYILWYPKILSFSYLNDYPCISWGFNLEPAQWACLNIFGAATRSMSTR